MKDFNFFEVYEQKASGARLGLIAAVLVALVVIAVPLGWWWMLRSEAADLRGEAIVIQNWLASPQVAADLKEFDAKNARIENLRAYADTVEKSSESIEQIGSLSTGDLRSIAEALPAEVNIESLEYADRNLGLTLRFADRAVAAETILRLKKADRVEDVTLGTIRYDDSEEVYEMVLYCRMKGGVLG